MRYCKVRDTFWMGVLSAGLEHCILAVELGSTVGCRNTYRELKMDKGSLRRKLISMGFHYEECMSGEFSPGGTYSLVGLWRFLEPIKPEDLQSVLLPLWGKIHGSELLEVNQVRDMKEAIKYSSKGMVRNYHSKEDQLKRLLMSDGWLPKGYGKINKFLIEWVFYMTSTPLEADQYSLPENDYVETIWNQKQRYIKSWCKGEKIEIYGDGFRVVIEGDKISKILDSAT